MSKQNLVYHYQKINDGFGFIDIEIEFELPEIPKESPKQEIEENLEEYRLGPRVSKKKLRRERNMKRKSIKINQKSIRDYHSNPQNSFMMR